MDRSTKLGTVLVCLFALPFAGFGLFALVTAIRQLTNGDTTTKTWLLVLFSLVFCGVGFGLMFAAFYGGRILKRQQRLQAEHPAEPWLWREDWAQGRIPSNTRSGMIAAWTFAALWNLVSMPVIWLVPHEAAKKPLAWIAIIFPVAGVFLLIRAISTTLAFAEFGRTFFEMAPVPGVIGGVLGGTIQTRFPHMPEHGIQLRLSCVNRVTSGSGNSRSTWEHILWRGETSVSSAQLYPGPSGVAIPVQFRIPGDARPADTSDARNTIAWQLEALADVPGVDYHDVFNVPVFRTAQTPSQPDPENSINTARHADRPAKPTVIVTEVAAGTEFYFPAARNPGFALGTSAFLLVFGGATCFLAGSRAPIIFPLAFGFFTLLLFYISVQMWLGTTRVGIGNGELLLQAGLLGGGTRRRFAFSDIASIQSAIRSQQGGGQGTPYYDIEMTLSSGRRVTLGRTLANRQEADWLVEEMRRRTRLQTKAAAAGR